MRFLDLGVAIMIGVSGLTGLAVWTPRGGDALASRMAVQAHLRDELLSSLDNRGLPWLLEAPPSEICAGLASAMDGTSSVFAQLGSESCGTPPPPGAITANLTLRLVQSEVNLVAWVGA